MLIQTIISEYRNLLCELSNAITNQTESDTSKRKTEGTGDSENDQPKKSIIKLYTPMLLILVIGLFGLITACSSSNSQPSAPPPPRSEERRVGKECRAWGCACPDSTIITGRAD